MEAKIKIQQIFYAKFLDLYLDCCEPTTIPNVRLKNNNKVNLAWSQYLKQLGLKRGGYFSKLLRFNNIAIFDPVVFADFSTVYLRIIVENQNCHFLAPKTMNRYIFMSKDFVDMTLFMGGLP